MQPSSRTRLYRPPALRQSQNSTPVSRRSRGLATDLRPFDAGSVAAIRVSNAGRPFVLAF
jgi:hypothetical protein